jgi:hypothetical protein
MRVHDLLGARESVSRLYGAKVDGRTALAIRRAVRKMREPLEDYEAALKSYVEAQGIKDGATFADLTTEQREHWNELLGADVEVTWAPAITADNLDSIDLSAAELDALIIAGLVWDDEPIENGMPQKAEEVPA